MLSSQVLLDMHRQAGDHFESGGLRSFVRVEGGGEPVLLVHDVTASSYSYRKLLPHLAAAGLTGVAFDLPGLGFADRPGGFDYRWTGLGTWAAGAVDDLGLDRFHLVVHGIGGPIGFEMIARVPDRVASLTILNAPVAVEESAVPWMLRPFASERFGRVWLALTRPPSFVRTMRRVGVAAPWVTDAELAVYLHQLRMVDGGAAFLKIMKGFEPTSSKQRLYADAIRSIPYRQVVWGEDDQTLGPDAGRRAAAVAGVAAPIMLPAKHFLQEDRSAEIAGLVAGLAGGS